jgi:hypothetical protein
MRKYLFLLILTCAGCQSLRQDERPAGAKLSRYENVRLETLFAWEAYEKYAWGHDELKPLSQTYADWYGQSFFIQGIDAYSTLKIMGYETAALRIENYVTTSLDFDRDIYVKTFEFNIRILGGLLSMYSLSGNQGVLEKAEDFGKRLLPAFCSGSGLPHYWVNLKTGQVRGDTVNVAEAGTFLLEMGVLSYYTQNPVYYQTAKKAALSIYSMRSPAGLYSENMNVETGQPTDSISHIGACIDSWYEYVYKGWLLFRDPELKVIWDNSIPAVHKYIADESDTRLWYGKVNAYSGRNVSKTVTLWDAYFPALLALSGDLNNAGKCQNSWNSLWNKHGLEPMIYDYGKDSILDPRYYLNPEIIESAYYLFYFTGDSTWYHMGEKYYEDIVKYCRAPQGYAHIENVIIKEQSDQMSTFFIAETMKYFYLLFSDQEEINPGLCVFSTEAHPFRKADFEAGRIWTGLGITEGL